jgi:capsular exopolysaccharide synthesis family protein
MLLSVGPPATPVQPSAVEYLRIIQRRKWWLIASTLLVTLAALGFSYSETKAYSATASILIEPVPTTASLTGSAPATLGVTDVATQEQVLGASQIRSAVKAAIGISGTISVGTVSGTNIITVTATEPTARESSRVANAYARAFIAYRAQQAVSSIDKATGQLQARLTGLETLAASIERQLSSLSSTSPTAQALQAELQAALSDEGVVQGQLEALNLGASTASGAAIVTSAKTPTAPSKPKTTRNVGLGLAAGILLGLAACVLVDNMDDSIRTKDELQELLGVPVLGLIPRVPDWKSPDQPMLVSSTRPQSPAAEAYRSLRTALQFVLLDKRVKTVLISSPLPGDGKTATTANLGVAMARAGQQVLVVSGDLRRPRLGAFLGCDEGLGLASIALGGTDLSEAVRPVPGVRGLWFLGTGPISPEPSEFLSSRRVSEIIASAADRYDLVLVDCAPLLPVADALAAVRWSDGMLVVAQASSTRRRDLRRSRELLDTADANIIGTVFNNVGENAMGYYGHGYYGGYGAPGTATGRHRRSRRKDGVRRETSTVDSPEAAGTARGQAISSAFRAPSPRRAPRTAE